MDSWKRSYASIFFNSLASVVERVQLRISTLSARARFRSFGRSSLIKQGSKLNHPESVVVGERVLIREYAWINAVPRADDRPSLVIDDGVYIGRFAQINAMGDVTIEHDVLISDRVFITDSTHDSGDDAVPIIRQGRRFEAPVKICSGCWIGIGAVILPGVTIGRNAIVGPNTVVHKDVPELGMAFGNPAKVVMRHGKA